VIYTLAPLIMKARAMVKPIPVPPPVTNATNPSSLYRFTAERVVRLCDTLIARKSREDGSKVGWSPCSAIHGHIRRMTDLMARFDAASKVCGIGFHSVICYVTQVQQNRRRERWGLSECSTIDEGRGFGRNTQL
jgi:hypothetical protein